MNHIFLWIFIQNWTLESNNVVNLEIKFFSYPRVCCVWLLLLFFLLWQAVPVLRFSLKYKLRVLPSLFWAFSWACTATFQCHPFTQLFWVFYWLTAGSQKGENEKSKGRKWSMQSLQFPRKSGQPNGEVQQPRLPVGLSSCPRLCDQKHESVVRAGAPLPVPGVRGEGQTATTALRAESD